MESEIKTLSSEGAMIANQQCPFCNHNNLTLSENEIDIPFFGKTYIFSLNCTSCKYRKSDVESAQQKPPSKFTLEITEKDDLNIRIVKSSTGTVNLPSIGKIESGPESDGYVTNVEGIIIRIRDQIKPFLEDEDEEVKKKSKNLLKKIQNILWGEEKIKLIIEDSEGNSAIISEKAIVEKLKH